MNGSPDARRDLHESLFHMHEALDRLEADDTLHELDYLLAGAAGLFRNGASRFEQLSHCLTIYGRPTPPAPVPLSSKVAA